MRRFELIEGNSSKFWEIEQADKELNIRWGRIGTAGQSQTKSFDDAAKAQTAMGKLVTEKTGKGYKEAGVAADASIGKTEAKPKAAAPAAAAAAAPATAATAGSEAPAAPEAGPATESLDAQCERVFEAVRAQIADGALKLGDKLSAAVLKRQHGVSEQGAAMAFDRLKSGGLIYGWGSTAQVQDRAQAYAKALGERAAAAPLAAQASTSAEPVPEGTPPWLAQGEPLRLTPQMQGLIYASRRFPQPVLKTSVSAAWLLVRQKAELSIDLSASDAALRPAAERMLARSQQIEPAEDPEADALLLTLALHTTGYYGESEPGEAVVDYLVARYGLPQAVDVWLAAQRVQVVTHYDHKTRSRSSSFQAQVTHAVSNGWRGPLGQGEAALRRHLAAASEDDWRASAERIEAGMPQLLPARQPVLALLLPDRPELSNALALRLGAEKDTPETLHWLLLTATEPSALAQAAKVRISYSTGFWGHSQMVATAVRERGMQAVAVLEKGAAADEAGEALAAIGTPEAVTALAKVASASKGALARLSLAVDRWPQAALVALSRLVAAGGKDAGLLTPSLTRLLRAHGSAVDALRPWLDAGAQGAIDRQLALLAGPSEVADAVELPGVLAAPPWLAKVQKKAAGTLALEPLALAAVEQWPEGAREQAQRPASSWQQNRYASARNDVEVMLKELGFESKASKLAQEEQQKLLQAAFEQGNYDPALIEDIQTRSEAREKELLATLKDPIRDTARQGIQNGDASKLIAAWRAMLAARKKERYYFFWFDASYTAQLPPALGVPLWNAIAGEAETQGAEYVMAHFGLPALAGLQSVVRAKPGDNLRVALNYGAVELAAPAARAFAKLKTVRQLGREWLLKFPEHAACGLIAPALGKAGEVRDAAGAALRLLQAEGHGALLLEVAGRYDNPAVVDALRAVLDESPLDRFPTKRVKLPEWWQPRGWRRPELLNGKALPDEALDALGQMLTFPTNEEVYGGIAVVKEACRPASLADFGWDAFSAWLEAGAVGKENWALTALGFLGSDDTARKLTPLIREWPGEAAHARAVTGLDVLAGIGSDVALMLLNGVAQKVKFKGLQDKAREKIDAIAQARGLSTEELEDRLAPDLGLDEQGTMVLDFGPRAFKVGFDETLKPYVREVDATGTPGARLPDLPKPKKTDDAALSKEATERFKLLKKDARTIASQQLLRLEVAMCARRRWTPEVFRLFLVEHPLVRHLVQRLIWGVYQVSGDSSYGGELEACFRVAEDGSFTTAEDDPFELPEGEHVRIGVPHALELPAADAAAFGQVFADYELLQPFAQIGRDTYTLTEAEQKADKLERWKGAKVPTGRVLGLVNKGWRRGQAQDGGGIWYFLKPLGASKVIELYLDPGIIVGMVDEYPEQELGEIKVGPPGSWGEIQAPEAFSALDAISASELIRDLEALRA
ncbi:WGR and DUF4132 domain-containing protein [Xenophilus arseniciresistens]|uniref:WGR and DUF4132 domain-containing protein n=1 Tax=Xenophilus arseniciresistens TaxID=1283306 RepID=A0AAE3N5G9_9BURK|nr:WGR and DUF4132 domain-containing protein [Xenophilus arseniciresistens]MDA7416250.1 WGR and DUF4132 domain-containing protein [Xenophilus arseniciresistens]